MKKSLALAPCQAIQTIGVRFIVTHTEVISPSLEGMIPAAGAVAALLTAATGVTPYSIGTPNPLMLRLALRQLGVNAADTVLISDRMDTEIVTGLASGLETILVLSGDTPRKAVPRYPYRLSRIVTSVAEIIP